MEESKLELKGILFDLDGTLLDTKPAYIEAARISLEILNQEIPEESELLKIPKRIEQNQQINDIVKIDAKKFLDLFLKTFYNIAAEKTRPVPDASLTLKILAKKAKLAVITMRFMPKESIMSELKQHGLDKYFAYVVTALDTVKPKPAPEALIRAVSAMDIQMCACAIVGDSVVDINAGKAAGTKTVAVLSGLYSLKELSEVNPDFVIEKVSELPKLLK
jgi:phosphoglycolate phosphatase